MDDDDYCEELIEVRSAKHRFRPAYFGTYDAAMRFLQGTILAVYRHRCNPADLAVTRVSDTCFKLAYENTVPRLGPAVREKDTFIVRAVDTGAADKARLRAIRPTRYERAMAAERANCAQMEFDLNRGAADFELSFAASTARRAIRHVRFS
jgi:hypothetical protein